MTKRQLQVFRFISSEVARTGLAPTLEEIAAHIGVRSRVTALDHVRALIASGHIRRRRYHGRGIEVVRLVPLPGECPACGRSA